MNRCPVCNKMRIKELFWENGKSVLKDTCVNPFCNENKKTNKERETFFKRIFGR